MTRSVRAANKTVKPSKASSSKAAESKQKRKHEGKTPVKQRDNPVKQTEEKKRRKRKSHPGTKAWREACQLQKSGKAADPVFNLAGTRRTFVGMLNHLASEEGTSQKPRRLTNAANVAVRDWLDKESEHLGRGTVFMSIHRKSSSSSDRKGDEKSVNEHRAYLMGADDKGRPRLTEKERETIQNAEDRAPFLVYNTAVMVTEKDVVAAGKMMTYHGHMAS